MPQITAHNKIVLKCGHEDTQYEEGILAAAATPGMNLVMTTATEASKRHTYTPGATAVSATATASSTVKILKEQILRGLTVDDALPIGDTVGIHVCMKGDIVQVRVASGQTVVKGGGAKAIASGLWNTSATDSVGEFLEASGGALAADTLMRVRIH